MRLRLGLSDRGQFVEFSVAMPAAHKCVTQGWPSWLLVGSIFRPQVGTSWPRIHSEGVPRLCLYGRGPQRKPNRSGEYFCLLKGE